MTHDAEQEIRQEFARWFDESSARDLDAVMAHMADDVVSYEHDPPLQFLGKEGIREVCQHGFDLQPDKFRWDIPDLQVIVRDDIAVTWGLNRMRGEAPGEGPTEMWSRGTRIFQKIDGRWQMIHQHVSFPVDPDSGEGRLDLKP